jgi:hypothetical protein
MWSAPLLLLCVYFYFHFYLQKLWEELGSLPAVLQDGRPLHAKVDPWLMNDLVRSHFIRLNTARPLLSYVQLWISVLLAWWVVPITMFLFWGRYLHLCALGASIDWPWQHCAKRSDRLSVGNGSSRAVAGMRHFSQQ